MDYDYSQQQQQQQQQSEIQFEDNDDDDNNNNNNNNNKNNNMVSFYDDEEDYYEDENSYQNDQPQPQHHHHEQQQQQQQKEGFVSSSTSSTAAAAAAAASDATGKLFVGGISWETTEDAFASYFRKFGEIKDSVIMMDRHSGRPRGFGFVTFSDPDVTDRVLKEEHIIDGRKVEVKRTVPRGDMEVKGIFRAKKVFVGGIPPAITEDELKEYFSLYGSVVEHQILQDHKTGRSRGFGFVTFESEDAVEKIFSERKRHELGGKLVEIKKAEPKRFGGDYGSGSKSYSGFNSKSSGYGPDHSSGDYYGGNVGRSHGGYDNYGGSYNAYGSYNGGYGGAAAGFYGGFGGYGYGYGFGGPMMYGGGGYGGGGGGYGGNFYGNPGGGYGGNQMFAGGKAYGRTGESGAKAYNGNVNGGGAMNGRHHPYRR